MAAPPFSILSADGELGAGELHRQRWTLVLVCATTFMLLLDVTVVTVALPSMQRSLSASLSDLQWVLNAYTLPLAALLLSAASLGDRLGRRRLFLGGVLLFTAGSLACALAPNPAVLNASRALQGTGGAALFAVGLPLIRQEFSEKALAAAVGAFGATIGLATAVGPLIGGALTDAFGWRSIFLVNLPVGVVALAAAAVHLPESRAADRRPIDIPGTALLTAGLILLILGLIRGNPDGWSSSTVVALLGAGTLTFVAFVAVEAAVAAPMVDLRLFRLRSFAVAGLGAFVVNAALVGVMGYLALYVQNTLGYGPFDSGLRFLPLSLTAFAVGAAAGGRLGRLPMRTQISGSLLAVAAGTGLLTRLTPGSTWVDLVPGLTVAGLGLGLSATALSRAALAAVEPNRAGMASGVVNALRQIGSAAGVAALGAVFQSTARTHTLGALAGTAVDRAGRAGDVAAAVASGGGATVARAAPAPARDLIAEAARQGTVAGLDRATAVAALAALLVALIAGACYPGPKSRAPGTAPDALEPTTANGWAGEVG